MRVLLTSYGIADPALDSQLTFLREVLLVFKDYFCISFVYFSKLFSLQLIPFTMGAYYLVALKVMRLAFKNL